LQNLPACIIAAVLLACLAANSLLVGSIYASAAPVENLDGKLFFVRTTYGKPSSSTDFYLANADGTSEVRLTDTGYSKGSPSWSPDGTKIVFSSSKDDTDGSLRESLYIMDLDGSHVRRLTAGRLTSDNSPAWSPDGSKIAFSRTQMLSQDKHSTRICILDIDAGTISQLKGSGSLVDQFPRWSPDGSKIAYTAMERSWSGSHLYIMNADGTNATRISQDPTDKDYTHYFGVWSPDGKRIAYATTTGLAVANSDGSNLKILNVTQVASYPSWTPDGKRIAFSRYDRYGSDSEDIFAINPDNDNDYSLPLIVSRGINESSPLFISINKNVTLNLKGLEAIADSAEKTAADLALANVKFLDPAPPEIGNRKVAFVRSDGPNTEIFVVNTDGSGLKKLTEHAFENNSPAWSPDGKRLAFVSNRDTDSGPFQVYTMDADGHDIKRLTHDTSYMDMDPSWSPDGKSIVFTRIPNTLDGKTSIEPSSHIYTMDADDGTGVERLAGTGGLDYSPRWSPDGSKIVFSGAPSGGETKGNEIYVMNADGTATTQLTHHSRSTWSTNTNPSWSSKGDKIVFMNNTGIITIDATDGGHLRVIRSSEWLYEPFWSPDGSKIIFNGPKDNFTRESAPSDFGLVIMNPDGTGIHTFLDDGDSGHSEQYVTINPVPNISKDQPSPPQVTNPSIDNTDTGDTQPEQSTLHDYSINTTASDLSPPSPIFNIKILSNADIVMSGGPILEKKLHFDVKGPAEKNHSDNNPITPNGYFEITIPHALLGGNYTVMVNNATITDII
jgi:TolB protein